MINIYHHLLLDKNVWEYPFIHLLNINKADWIWIYEREINLSLVKPITPIIPTLKLTKY